VKNPNCEFEMDTDLRSSSRSCSPIVVKILIDADEYFQLMQRKKTTQKQYDQMLDKIRQEEKLEDELETQKQYDRLLDKVRQEKKLKDELETSQQQQGKRNCPKDGFKIIVKKMVVISRCQFHQHLCINFCTNAKRMLLEKAAKMRRLYETFCMFNVDEIDYRARSAARSAARAANARSATAATARSATAR
jgi:hypothetical protein